ncbi:deaminase domain-containing protein [Paraclostridium bifermentans]|uniref:deaminase domain-containing protein n=1 Tax=Paraclostridium bifermentans TaxID=1490 RepID=UPI0018A0C914|nr:deaminase domain-containing protein [Paraclostridium bifermentans]
MIERNNKVKSTKKDRIKIRTIKDFIKVLQNENYNLSMVTEEDFEEEIINRFNVNNKICEEMYRTLNNGNITYKVNGVKGFIDYIESVIIFEDEHNKLCEKINKIKTLIIDRVEYERILTTQDDVEHILKIIEETKKSISGKINEEGKIKLESLEDEINRDYVYAKDIELLKRMILCNNKNVKEEYDEKSQTKTLFIEIPQKISFDYVKAEKGTVEYYQHIKSYIPRMKRLIKNLDKYIMEYNNTYKINQSIAIQDSVNMAIVIYNGKEFRAVSGKNDIENSCTLIQPGQEYFESCKVNKLGKLGIGYNRINDSEKKILEKIHRLIEDGSLTDEGELILYSKWEPCPSCYYVISQFIKKYPKINLKVMYYKEYGEK